MVSRPAFTLHVMLQKQEFFVQFFKRQNDDQNTHHQSGSFNNKPECVPSPAWFILLKGTVGSQKWDIKRDRVWGKNVEERTRTSEIIWGRADMFLTRLLRQRRPHSAKEKTRWAVPSFFTSGSECLMPPPPPSTSHLDLTAINIWCSNCTLKHDSPTGPVAQSRATSFYTISKIPYLLPIICNNPACIFVLKMLEVEQPNPLSVDKCH